MKTCARCIVYIGFGSRHKAKAYSKTVVSHTRWYVAANDHSTSHIVCFCLVNHTAVLAYRSPPIMPLKLGNDGSRQRNPTYATPDAP